MYDLTFVFLAATSLIVYSLSIAAIFLFFSYVIPVKKIISEYFTVSKWGWMTYKKAAAIMIQSMTYQEVMTRVSNV